MADLIEPDRLHDQLAAIVADAATQLDDYEASEKFPRDLVERVCALGLPDLVLRPSEQPEPTTLFCLAIEQLATGWVALAEAVHLQTLATLGLARFGSSALQQRLLPDLLAGRAIGGNGLSEPTVGSDLAAIATRAEPDGDGYRLTGVKAWVGHAEVAQLLNIWARTAGGGLGGITCFLVDTDSPGLTVGPPADKMSIRALPTSPVTLDGVRVGADRILGRLHRGMIVADSLFRQGRIGIAACAVGLAQAALDRAVDYARTRSQFGSAVLAFQGISFPLADAATQIEAARQLLHRACREIDHGGRRADHLAAQAKLFATDTAVTVTGTALQVLGGYGCVRDEPVERWLREARVLQIIEGTNQIQRAAIAANL